MKIAELYPLLLVAENPDDPEHAFGKVMVMSFRASDYFLFGLRIDKDFRGNGHARRLVERALEFCDDGRMYLCPRESGDVGLKKDDLIRFYERCGFEVVDAEDHGYNGKNTLMVNYNGQD